MTWRTFIFCIRVFDCDYARNLLRVHACTEDCQASALSVTQLYFRTSPSPFCSVERTRVRYSEGFSRAQLSEPQQTVSKEQDTATHRRAYSPFAGVVIEDDPQFPTTCTMEDKMRIVAG